MHSKNTAIFLVLCFFFIFAGPASGKSGYGHATNLKSFHRSAALAGGYNASVVVISASSDGKRINDALSRAFEDVRKIAKILDRNDPSSELSGLNRQAGGEAVSVSKPLIRILQHGKKLNRAIGREFDITDSGDSSRIKIDTSAKTVTITKPGIKLNLDGIVRGYLADMLLASIYNSNVDNAMVKIDGVSRSVGRDIDGPWQFSAYDPTTGGYAHRAVKLSFSNLAIATVGEGGWSPPSAASTNMLSISVLGKDAATTNAIATAAYKMGPGKGMALVVSKGYRCVMIENGGRITKSPGL